jgi:hypothetical protein
MGTFSLVHSADMVLRVMAEVRAREDEYDAVKALAAAIGGLPHAGRPARPRRPGCCTRARWRSAAARRAMRSCSRTCSS